MFFSDLLLVSICSYYSSYPERDISQKLTQEIISYQQLYAAAANVLLICLDFPLKLFLQGQGKACHDNKHIIAFQNVFKLISDIFIIYKEALHLYLFQKSSFNTNYQRSTSSESTPLDLCQVKNCFVIIQRVVGKSSLVEEVGYIKG